MPLPQSENNDDRAEASKLDCSQWQFSLRSVMMTVTIAAVFLSVCMTVPGLKELPYVVAFIILTSVLCFAIGCLLGWMAE